MTTQHTKLFLIRARKKDDGLDDDPEWWEKVGRFIESCRSCGSYASFYPKPLTAVVQNRQRSTQATSGWSGYRLLKRPFYEMLAPYMPGVVAGEVRFGDGRVQKDCVTLNFPSDMAILLRGGHGSRAKEAYKTCKECGRRVSALAMLNPPIYVLRSEIPPDREVFNSNIFIALSESLVGKLDFTPFPDLKLQPIGVFDTPVEYVPEIGDVEPQQDAATS